MVSRECIFRIPCQLISVRLFFCLCAFEYHAFVWNKKCISQSGYNLCMGVSRTCVQISAVGWRCCRVFSKFFTFHRRFNSWSMCIWHPENAITNISAFILFQWVRLLVYSKIWIMPCIFWNGTVSSMSARERMCAYILVMLAHEQTFVEMKNALESCSGFDWNEEMEFRLSLSPNVHCAHLNAYSQ